MLTWCSALIATPIRRRILEPLPLLLIIGFGAILFFNLPYAWKLGGCPAFGLGACFPITHDWSNFALDLVFYTLLGYWAIVVGNSVDRRLFRSGLSEKLWKREVLKGRFKIALLGGFLMLAVPMLALPNASGARTIICVDPFPCVSNPSDQVFAGWNLTMALWAYSIFLVIVVSLLGVVEDKWHRLLGVALIGLSGLYLAGVGVFFSTGAYTLFPPVEAIIGGILLPVGPVLVLSGGLLAISHQFRKRGLVPRICL